MKLSFIAAFTALAVAFPAQAADYSWQVRSQTDDGKVLSIVAENESNTGVMLNCTSDRLTAGVGIEPGLISDRLDKFTSRTKRKKATMTIGEGNPKREVWTYLPAMKVAISRQGTTGRRLFNAAVRGDTVNWSLDGKGSATFTLPEQNEAFKKFAKSCSVTNGS